LADDLRLLFEVVIDLLQELVIVTVLIIVLFLLLLVSPEDLSLLLSLLLGFGCLDPLVDQIK